MSNIPKSAPVVVGIDFSKANEPAVAYAAAEAVRRVLPLELVYAVDPQWPTQGLYIDMPMASFREDAEAELDAAAEVLRREHPTLQVRTRFVALPASEALVEASIGAAITVVGSRGHGGFAQLVLGSVAWQVAARGRGTVILVRPDGDAEGAGPVLVGIDGLEPARSALRFACDEAMSRGTSLVAVTIWTALHPVGVAVERAWPTVAADWADQAAADADRILSEALAGLGESHPGLQVDRHVVHGVNVADALLAVADRTHADVVVVGAGGRHAITQLVLGATGIQLSQHADRNVAVVHA